MEERKGIEGREKGERKEISQSVNQPVLPSSIYMEHKKTDAFSQSRGHKEGKEGGGKDG